MEEFVVERDNLPDLRFTGELLVHESSSDDLADPNFSGSPGRCTVYDLYRTKGGNFVCSQVSLTYRDGERDRQSGAVCTTPAGVVAFFGQNRFAKCIYEQAGIENAEVVE